MAANITPRLHVPREASAGEAITILTMVSYPMGSGLRRDPEGILVPRAISNRFVVEFEGEIVLDAALEPAVSANPVFEFDVVVPKSGTLAFAWYDDDGSVYTETAEIVVT
jgi:sulfur-oxidizing protein SoxZ